MALEQLGELLGLVLFDRLDKSLVRGQRAQRSSHVRIDYLQTVDVAGVDPAESVWVTKVSS